MLNLFRKNEKFFRAIKLYSIDQDQGSIDRPLLIVSILKLLKGAFGDYPNEYDIHGPYGIKKGATVDLITFQRKLSKKGHSKYYALNGYTEGKFAFNVVFDAKLRSSTYSELIIWYSLECYTLDFRRAVECLIRPFSTTSGFELDISQSYNVVTETQIKKGILGGITVEVNSKHREWLLNASKGQVRDLFVKNLWNDNQISHIKSLGIEFSSYSIQGLHLVEFNDPNKVNIEKKKIVK